MTAARPAKPYANPYVAGFGLGLVLLATYAIMGHGIGASGAAASAVAAGVDAVAPSHAQGNAYYGAYIGDGAHSPLRTWIVFEVIGIFIGALVSAALAGRLHRGIERGPRIGAARRMRAAVLGGVLMGFASRLARGCTSGQALTGGAVLSVGSWIFMLALFATAFALAPLLRREWT